MKLMKFIKLILQNIKRNKKSFIFSSIGIIVGISTFVFFVSLGQGIKTLVLEKIFIIRQLEVIPKRFEVSAIQTELGARPLDDEAVEEFKKIPGVAAVYPKQKFTFPAWAKGGKEILGRSFRAEIIADGLPPELVRDEIERGDLFIDWEMEFTCQNDEKCPPGRECLRSTCQKMECKDHEKSTDCPDDSYCAEDTLRCEVPIPVIVSPNLLELYNGSLQTALANNKTGVQPPKLSRQAIIGFTVEVSLGESYLGKAAQGKRIWRQMKVVGFSTKAIGMGVTLPIQYVERFNFVLTGEKTQGVFHSVIVETETNDDVAGVANAITEEMGFALDPKNEDAKKAGMVITIITAVFSLISVIIIIIASFNIMHTFLMVVVERRKEIGIMRAIGATQRHIRLLFLLEAALIGLFGGAVGSLSGWLAGKFLDYLSNSYLPNFPYKPETFFSFEPWIIFFGIIGAIFFCIIGAFLPAYRASVLDPARTLTMQ